MNKKEYLKMSGVFPSAVHFDSDGGIGAVVDSQGEYIAQAMENNYCSHMSNKNKNEYRNAVAKYIAHSIASHDDLVAENEQLRKSLLWAINNLQFEHPYEWSDDTDTNAHYESLRVLGFDTQSWK